VKFADFKAEKKTLGPLLAEKTRSRLIMQSWQRHRPLPRASGQGEARFTHRGLPSKKPFNAPPEAGFPELQ